MNDDSGEPNNPVLHVVPSGVDAREIERGEAEALLRQPDLMDRFLLDVGQTGLVGERDVAKVVLLTALSRITPDPIALKITGSASTGKNAIVRAVLAFFPPEVVLEVADLSPKLLFYLRKDELHQKVLFLTELVGARKADYSIRILLSERKLTKRVVGRGEHGREAQEYVVDGQCALITTTTGITFHSETETRLFDVATDESREQTQAVLRELARSAEAPHQRIPEAIDRRRRVWQRSLGLIEARAVAVPDASALADDFPTDRPRARRDFQKVLSMVRAHALLYSRQRAVNTQGNILASGEDVQAARELCVRMFLPPDPKHRRAIETLRGAFAEGEFTIAHAAKLLGYRSDEGAAKLLSRLSELGYVNCTKERSGSEPSLWRLA